MPARLSSTPAKASYWHPRVKGLILMVSSIYNGSRFEDLWFDD
jgi:peptide/nickel transport system substrate-binding protein